MTPVPESIVPELYVEFAATPRNAIRKMQFIRGKALVGTGEFDDIFTELPVWRILLHHYAN